MHRIADTPLYTQLQECLPALRAEGPNEHPFMARLDRAQAQAIYPYVDHVHPVNYVLYHGGSFRGYVDESFNIAIIAGLMPFDKNLGRLTTRRINLHNFFDDVDWALPDTDSATRVAHALRLKYLDVGQRSKAFNIAIDDMDRIFRDPVVKRYIRREHFGENPQATEQPTLILTP